MKYSYLLFCLLFTGNIAVAQRNDVVEDEVSSNYNLNKPAREEWLRNTGAGLFIHFNVDAQLGIVISHALVGASDDFVNRYFNDLPKTFNPSSFNPKEIAELARLAGMKYICFTTKHHAGFCFWDTKTTDFNITKTPYKKDLLKEFVEATRAAGLDVGFYFSPEDFRFLYDHKIPISRSNVRMDEGTRMAYDDYNRKQVEELMTKYGKVDVLFIDGDPKEVVKETSWRLQPDILITRGAIKTPEQTLPGTKITQPWLSPITMGTAWQFQPTNDRYKSGSQLIDLLIEARAKGGSLLLNVGPKANGALPEEQENRLREMAGWYFINHEAMDDVRSWVVSKEGNIWFTRKDNILFAIVMDAGNWKEGERRTFTLRSAKSTADTKISVLGQNSQIMEYKPDLDVSSRFRQTDNGLELSVLKAQRIYDDHRWPNPVVIKLENVNPVFKEAAMVQTGDVQPAGQGVVLMKGRLLNYRTVKAARARFYYRPYLGQVETLYAEAWKETIWTPVKKEGSFDVQIKGLKKGVSYEYKAIVEQQQVLVEGENKVWSNK
ncbi:probable glycosyl hydrolase [Pedobacter sp. BAL39]|uniref:alpha-L-fucosidase n=1 Tax=Pedobacter sp. BAL39 TaxID=391596 RepID=UPI000155AC43|nr:alpha-L-fucosidase [Pedobacter sp. BAL39]EDM34708.1 probable glycosyl hydrolase [Pedobacter sp. BAL39]